MSVADKIGFGPTREIAYHMTHWTVTVTPHPFFNIGKRSATVRLNDNQMERYVLWRKGGLMIQDALPELTVDERDKLLGIIS